MITCSICGKQEDPEKFAELAEKIRMARLCFKCLFWKGKASVRDRLNTAIISGNHFTIGSTTEGIKGYNGQRFNIKFFDGRKITTTNLWHQGKIPKHFRKALPDNAEFVKEGVEHENQTHGQILENP